MSLELLPVRQKDPYVGKVSVFGGYLTVKQHQASLIYPAMEFVLYSPVMTL